MAQSTQERKLLKDTVLFNPMMKAKKLKHDAEEYALEALKPIISNLENDLGVWIKDVRVELGETDHKHVIKRVRINFGEIV